MCNVKRAMDLSMRYFLIVFILSFSPAFFSYIAFLNSSCVTKETSVDKVEIRYLQHVGTILFEYLIKFLEQTL